MRGNPVTGFGAVQNDADVRVIAAPHQEFCSTPVENLLRQGPTRPVIDCCALWKRYTAREHLGDTVWSENEPDVNIPESESGTRYFPIRRIRYAARNDQDRIHLWFN